MTALCGHCLGFGKVDGDPKAWEHILRWLHDNPGWHRVADIAEGSGIYHDLVANSLQRKPRLFVGRPWVPEWSTEDRPVGEGGSGYPKEWTLTDEAREVLS